MLKIIADGERSFRLENPAGIDVGWINAQRIGFHGFPTEARTIRAAVEASRALHAALQREYHGFPRYHIDPAEIRLVHDGAYEWVAAGNRPLARILRPATGPFGQDVFGIELQAPSYASTHVTVAGAHAIWRAIESRLKVAAEKVAAGSRPSRVFPFRRGPARPTLPISA